MLSLHSGKYGVPGSFGGLLVTATAFESLKETNGTSTTAAEG